MIKTEKATYSRLALNEGLKQLKAVHLTASRKACYYPIFDSLKTVSEWLEDYAGNRAAFYCCRLEEYRDRLYRHYKETTKADFARLARLTKRDMTENILSILREGEAGNDDDNRTETNVVDFMKLYSEELDKSYFIFRNELKVPSGTPRKFINYTENQIFTTA